MIPCEPQIENSRLFANPSSQKMCAFYWSSLEKYCYLVTLHPLIYKKFVSILVSASVLAGKVAQEIVKQT